MGLCLINELESPYLEWEVLRTLEVGNLARGRRHRDPHRRLCAGNAIAKKTLVCFAFCFVTKSRVICAKTI